MAHLSRLASKPEVRATLILSRSDGAIVHSSGLASAAPLSDDSTAFKNGGQDGQNDELEPVSERDTAEEIARMVFNVVNAAGLLAGGLAATGSTTFGSQRRERTPEHSTEKDHRDREGADSGIDDVQLLRVRTRKGEAVIVPGEYRCSSESV